MSSPLTGHLMYPEGMILAHLSPLNQGWLTTFPGQFALDLSVQVAVTPVGAANRTNRVGRPGGADHRATNSHRGSSGIQPKLFALPCVFPALLLPPTQTRY